MDAFCIAVLTDAHVMHKQCKDIVLNTLYQSYKMEILEFYIEDIIHFRLL